MPPNATNKSEALTKIRSRAVTDMDIIVQQFDINQFVKQLANENGTIGGINIFNVGQICIGNGKKIDNAKIEDMLYVILCGLPEPKLESLKNLAYLIALTHFDSYAKAGNWLGVSSSWLNQWMRDYEQDKLIDNIRRKQQ